METILIQNFKAIKNTAKREIKVANLTILMGEQATGKSTVAKLVYFFKNIPEKILDTILNKRNINLDNFEEELVRNIHVFFRHLFGSSDRLVSFVISYKYINGLQLRISKNLSQKNYNIDWSESLKELVISSLIIAKEFDRIRSEEFEKTRREQQYLLDQLIFIVNNFFGSDQRSLYVPASRNAIVTLDSYLMKILPTMEIESRIKGRYFNSENDYFILEFIYYIQSIKGKFKGKSFREFIEEGVYGVETKLILNEVTDRIKKIMVGEYRYDQEDEILINGDGSYVSVANSSSGQQEAIRIIQDIFLEILEGKPIFRVYEEPESHLSPVGQLGIIQLIAMLANRNPDNQIIIPTHTPYLLYEINNMLEASKIVKDHPELSDEVSKILKPFYWLDIENVSAYQLNRDGEIEDARDLEYQMVDGMLFDKVTNDTSGKFEELLRLQHEA